MTAASVTETLVRVNYSETDQMGVAYHARYLVWLDIARTEHLRRCGLSYRDLEAAGLRLAVSEVAANTLRHTRSPGTLAIWHDADEVVCEIHDEGTITDPLAGSRRPPPDASGGHGLWLVRQVCDLVELTSDANGTTVRMHMALRQPGAGG